MALAALGMIMPGAGKAQPVSDPARTATIQTAGFKVAQQTYSDVIAQLQDVGYRIVEVKSTFLGRIRILARNKVHLREVIVSRSTGEIKRDVILELIVADVGNNSDITSSGTDTSGGSPEGGATGSGSVNVGASAGGTSAGVSVSGGGTKSKAGVSAGGLSLGN